MLRPLLILRGLVLAGATLVPPAASPQQLPAIGSPATAGRQTSPARDAEAPATGRLEAVRAELAQVEQSVGKTVDVPAGVPAAQVQLRQVMLGQTVRALQQRIDDESSLERLQAPRKPVDQRLGRWMMDESRAPFSLLSVEALRSEVQLRLRGIEMLTASLAALDAREETTRSLAGQTAQAARQLLERIEKRDGAVSLLLWERDLHLLRGRLQAALLEALEARRRLLQARLSVARSELAFLQGELDKTDGRVDFSDRDAKAMSDSLDSRLEVLDAELQRHMAAAGAARRDLSTASARLERASAGADPGSLRHQRNAVTLAELRLETVQALSTATRLTIEAVENQRSVWNEWFEIVRAGDAHTARRLSAILDGHREANRKLDLAARASFRYSLGQLAEVERAMLSAADAEDSAFLREKSSRLRERAEMEARLLADVLAMQDLIERWRTGFVSETAQQSATSRVEAWKERSASVLRAIWSFELFSATDTIEVDGRKLTAERSVTLGKVVSAIVIFLVTLWATRTLVGVVSRVAVRRWNVDANQARLVGKWVLSLVFVALLAFSLNAVKIPFTVFAFLGGAVAIGVGFGTQTLLKNLISGLMLLAERPFRLGDVVEVGGIRGTVTDINVRSSLIRDRNGVETLVPNSAFLEQNVTNWTYSSNRVRDALNVGVAYGSPSDKVREILRDVAARYASVLRTPEPEVYFDAFGDDALLFSLQYWIDMGVTKDARRVASDLRFMIEKAFADAGISMAFPQRDVHLDTSKPLTLQFVGPDGNPTSERDARAAK